MTTSEDEAFALAWPTEAERAQNTTASAPEPLVIENLWADETPLKWAPAPADPAPRPPAPEPAQTPRPAADETGPEAPDVRPVPVVRTVPIVPARSVDAPRTASVAARATERPRLTMRVRLARSTERTSSR